MKEEIARVLKMVEEGKMTSEQAVQLIEALKISTVEEVETPNVKEEASGFDRESFLRNDLKASPGEKFLQIRILSGENDKVKINLPLNFVKGVLKVTGKLPMIQVEQMEGVDVPAIMETIMAAIDSDLTGRLVDVESSKGDLVIVEIV
jgi:hypothetical protein